MLSPALRIVLIAGSLITVGFMLVRIRAAKIQIRDTIFWLVFALALLVLSIFPDIATWASRLLGFAAPINFVYLFIIFLLLVKQFSSSLQIAKLEIKLRQLAQRQALDNHRPPDAPRDTEL